MANLDRDDLEKQLSTILSVTSREDRVTIAAISLLCTEHSDPRYRLVALPVTKAKEIFKQISDDQKIALAISTLREIQGEGFDANKEENDQSLDEDEDETPDIIGAAVAKAIKEDNLHPIRLDHFVWHIARDVENEDYSKSLSLAREILADN